MILPNPYSKEVNIYYAFTILVNARRPACFFLFTVTSCILKFAVNSVVKKEHYYRAKEENSHKEEYHDAENLDNPVMELIVSSRGQRSTLGPVQKIQW